MPLKGVEVVEAGVAAVTIGTLGVEEVRTEVLDVVGLAVRVVDAEGSPSQDLLFGRGLTSSTTRHLSLLEVPSRSIIASTLVRDLWESLSGSLGSTLMREP